MKKGYARVSTSEQETTLQLDALRRYGVRVIFQEKRSGVKVRPELARLLASLAPDDVVVVYKVDRVARSLISLLSTLEVIEAAGASFVSLTEPIDTVSHAGKMMLHMLGAFAQFERSLIRERTMAGQQAAKKRGVHVGRPSELSPDDQRYIARLHKQGFLSLANLAEMFDVSPSVIKRAVYRVHNPSSSSLR